MRFAWDDAKNSANIRKHGLSLAKAKEMFEGPTVERDDTRKDYGERRIVCYGIVGERVCCCVYTDRGDSRRIISLRRANVEESHDYFEAIGL